MFSLAENNDRQKKINLLAWISYDISETLFSLLIVTLIYAIYFREVIANGSSYTDFYWGVCGSLSMAIVALLSPLCGAAADIKGRRKTFLLLCGFSASFFIMLLAIPQRGDIVSGCILFIIASIFYGLSLTFYNSLIADVSTSEDIGRVSGFGWSAGYAGALLCLAIFYPLLKNGMEEENLYNIKIIFIITGTAFIIFMLPIMFFFKESEKKNIFHSGDENIIINSFRRVLETLRNVKKYKNLVLFLAAYFLFNDGIATVIYFSSIFASHSLGFSMRELISLFLVVQLSAMAGAFLFGFITDKLGAKKVIIICLLLWCILILKTYTVADHTSFFIIALAGGIAMGACQSASRTFMGLSIPAGRESEFFGFYSLYGRFSSIIGPLVFGTAATVTGDRRKAVLGTLIFFLGGLILIYRVKDPSCDSR